MACQKVELDIMSNASFPSLHDASLDVVAVSVIDGTCVVRIAGVSGDLPTSAWVELTCSQLNSFFLVVDGEEIQGNASSGNVQDGRIEAMAQSDVFRLYLAGGMLEAGGILSSSVIPRVVHGAFPHPDAVRESTPLDRDLADALHCAVFTHVSLAVEHKEIVIQLLASADSMSIPRSKDLPRRAATVTLQGISSCVMRFDASTVGARGPLGNVRNCLVDEARGVLWFYLENGIVEVKAERALIAFG